MKEGFIASIAHFRFENPIEVCCDAPVTLTVENPVELYKTVCELKRQCESGDGEFVFTFADKKLSYRSCCAVTDLSALDINDKKTVSALYKELVAASSDGELQIMYGELVAHIAQYLRELAERVNAPAEFDEPDVNGLLKLNNVRLQDDGQTLLERLVCFINAEVALRQRRLFFFAHLKCYLSDGDLLNLYKHCETEKIGLVLIEGRGQRNRLLGEKSVTITEDLCEIS